MPRSDTVARVTQPAKRTGRKAAGTARASAGKAADAAGKAATTAGADAAAETIAEVDAMHYQVEVNKRGLSVTALTKTLNDRWENGWPLAHILEQRGNTVLVFEKRA